MKCVMIIRAEPAATATASKLAERGFEVIKLPLFEFHETGAEIPDQGFCAIALTSSNAVRALESSGWKPADPNVPVYCIGSRTLEAARSYGLKNLVSFDGDRNSMIKAICENHADATAPVLYPAARDCAFDLPGALKSLGIGTQLVEVYAMEKKEISDERFHQGLAELGSGTILVHSRRSADYLAELFSRQTFAGRVEEAGIVAISEQAAEPLSRITSRKLMIAENPTEAAMLSLLDASH